MNTKDELIIGGHSFSSRFILGSGKYSLNLIEAAVKRRRSGDHNAGSAPRQHKRRRKHHGLYPGKRHSAAKHFGCARCGRSGEDRKTGQGAGLRRFRQDRDNAGFQIPAAGQQRDREEQRRYLAKEGFVVMPYMYPDLNTAQRPGGRRSCSSDAAGIADRFEQRARDERIHTDLDKRDRSSDHRRRRHRQTVTGMRGNGNGRSSYNGEHRAGNGRRSAADGIGIQTVR